METFCTFDLGLRPPERGVLHLLRAEVLQAPVGVLQECLRGAPGQGAGLEEGLLLLLVLVDELQHERHLVLLLLRLRGGARREPVVVALVLALKAVEDRAHLQRRRKKPGCEKKSLMPAGEISGKKEAFLFFFRPGEKVSRSFERVYVEM